MVTREPFTLCRLIPIEAPAKLNLDSCMRASQTGLLTTCVFSQFPLLPVVRRPGKM